MTGESPVPGRAAWRRRKKQTQCAPCSKAAYGLLRLYTISRTFRTEELKRTGELKVKVRPYSTILSSESQTWRLTSLWDTNTLGLARGGDLEEVGVDASGSDRRARAGALDHERLWRVTRRVEGDDVVGVLGAREGVRLRVLAQLDRALLTC